MPDLTIYLDPKEKSALDELARLTLRDPHAQAKIILVNGADPSGGIST